jgi:hypothetical protein
VGAIDDSSLDRPLAPSTTWVWLYKAILALLFFGPLIAPLFQATHMPAIADSGALARDLLARFVCPTPAKSYVLLGFPMAVCARCWGATIGLWGAWFLLRPRAKDQGPRIDTVGHPVSAIGRWSFVVGLSNSYTNLSWPLRLAIGALPFLLWVLEIDAWPAAPLEVLLANGALVGFAAGLFFCSIWPGMRQIESLERHYE